MAIPLQGSDFLSYLAQMLGGLGGLFRQPDQAPNLGAITGPTPDPLMAVLQGGQGLGPLGNMTTPPARPAQPGEVNLADVTNPPLDQGPFGPNTATVADVTGLEPGKPSDLAKALPDQGAADAAAASDKPGAAAAPSLDAATIAAPRDVGPANTASNALALSLFGNLTDPKDSFINNLLATGTDPFGGNPLTQAAVQQSAASMLPVLQNLLQNPQQIQSEGGDSLINQLRAAAQGAVTGQQGYYTPEQAMGVVKNLQALANSYRQQIQADPNSPLATNAGVQTIIQMASDPKIAQALVTSAMTSGLAPDMQAMIAKGVGQNARRREVALAQNGQTLDQASQTFLDMLLGR